MTGANESGAGADVAERSPTKVSRFRKNVRTSGWLRALPGAIPVPDGATMAMPGDPGGREFTTRSTRSLSWRLSSVPV